MAVLTLLLGMTLTLWGLQLLGYDVFNAWTLGLLALITGILHIASYFSGWSARIKK